MTYPVVVAGAGIGGLTAALALNARGHEVAVIERAEALEEVGAGLQLSPNATRILRDLKVLDTLGSKAVRPDHIVIGSARQGAEITRIPLGDQIEARHGAPYLVVHRADLQMALYQTAKVRSGITFKFGTTVHKAEDDAEGPLICHADAKGETQEIRALALIGADGVWSKTRLQVPGHSEAAYSGLTAYRATIPTSQVGAGLLKNTGLWLGPNAHLVHYPLCGGDTFNLVALVPEKWTEEGWAAKADRQVLLGHFGKWAPSLRSLLAQPGTWLKWALCGVDGAGSWTHGRIALLGDAAHGMLPFAAQGAAMAIEDAAVLANKLSPEENDVAHALKTYETARKDRVVKVQKTAVENGRIYHLSGPIALGRDMTMKLMRPEKLASRLDWIYGWTPDDLQ